MRVAVFGGSFDPIHMGHLWIAELTREAMQLDEVLFIPAATSPLKPTGPVASNDQRLAMLRLAVSGHRQFRVDTCELDREGLSYTVETVQRLKRERSADDFFLLVGTDAFNSLDRWKEPELLLTMVTPIVVGRGGETEPDWTMIERLVGNVRKDEIRAMAVRIPLIELSSSELRENVTAGRSIRYRVPRPVEAYIHAENIYR